MHLSRFLFILTFAISGFAKQAPVSSAFEQGVARYIKILRDLESSVPAQQSTNEPEQIADRQQQLARLIADARRGAHQGEIFSVEVAEQFRKIIRKAFDEPGGKAMRKTIQERDPVRRIVLKVNDLYPDDQPHTTIPPTLLDRLPVLPKELAYRIIGRALVLQGAKTDLIVDFIPNAIP